MEFDEGSIVFELWRKWIAYPLGWLAGMAIVIGLLAWAGSSTVKPNGQSIDQFDGQYRASLVDGRVELAVTETYEVLLRGDRGLVRDLPNRHGDATLDYRDIEVTQTAVEDDAEPPVGPVLQVENYGATTRIRMGDDVRKRGDYVYQLDYVIHSAMLDDGERQELYFNTTGTEWTERFDEFTAELVLDDALAAARLGEHACYAGPRGSTERCEVTVDGATYRVQHDGLDAGENITLAVGFAPGTATTTLPPFAAASWGWWGIGSLVAVGLLGLGVALVQRRWTSNLTGGEEGVVTQFDAPEGLLPITGADFLGRSDRGAAAHLAWLIVEGHGKLTSTRKQQPAGPQGWAARREARTSVHALRLTWQQGKLTSLQRWTTQHLFGKAGEELQIRLDFGRDRRAVDDLRGQLLDEAGLRNRNRWILPVFWIGYLALWVLGFMQLWRGLAGLGWWFLLAGALAATLLCWAVHLAPHNLAVGRRARETRRHLMGLRRFVTMAEADRIAWLQSVDTAPRDDEGRLHLYERLLPWAIVFGAEETWAAAVGELTDRFDQLGIPHLESLPDVPRRLSIAADDPFRQRSNWADRKDLGDGVGMTTLTTVVAAAGAAASGIASASESNRRSGRGWGGGRSGGGGSRGGGFSGGGIGGGGGSRW